MARGQIRATENGLGKEIEKKLWAAADKLRGSMDAAEPSIRPGPIEGSWSMSPTKIKAAWSRLKQGMHQRHVDHRDLVHDQQVALERILLAALEPAPGRIRVQQRCMVLASCPVASLIRLTAQPMGAARTMAVVLAPGSAGWR